MNLSSDLTYLWLHCKAGIQQYYCINGRFLAASVVHFQDKCKHGIESWICCKAISQEVSQALLQEFAQADVQEVRYDAGFRVKNFRIF